MASMRYRLLAGLAIAVLLCTGWASQLTILWPDIEQGACTLIIGPDGTGVLIDAGTLQPPQITKPQGTPDQALVPWLHQVAQTYADFKLQYIVVTHYHQDHIQWIEDVVAAGFLEQNGVVYDRGGSYTSATFTRYSRAVAPYRKTISLGDTIPLGDGAFLICLLVAGEVYGGGSVSTKDENNLSTGLLLSYKDFQLWVGGDSGHTVEAIAGPVIGDVDVYVVHHHGSDGSSSTDFLSTIKAEVAICQVGANPSDYNHPRLGTIERILAAPDTHGNTTNGTPFLILQNRGYYTSTLDRVYIADPDTDTGGRPGTISLLTDGYSYTIEALGLPKPLRLFTDSIGLPVTPTETVKIVRVPGPCTVVLGNFTDKPIPIGGWDIRDNTTFFMIPSGTILPPYGTLVVEVTAGCHTSGFWVAQKKDYVLLYDAYGVLVDRWEGRPSP